MFLRNSVVVPYGELFNKLRTFAPWHIFERGASTVALGNSVSSSWTRLCVRACAFLHPSLLCVKLCPGLGCYCCCWLLLLLPLPPPLWEQNPIATGVLSPSVRLFGLTQQAPSAQKIADRRRKREFWGLGVAFFANSLIKIQPTCRDFSRTYCGVNAKGESASVAWREKIETMTVVGFVIFFEKPKHNIFYCMSRNR